MKNALKKTSLVASLALLAACNNIANNKADHTQLVGIWLQPNPINSADYQGFELLEDGLARSVNTATLQYEKWWEADGKLFLVAKSIGNHQTFTDTTEYSIVKLNGDSLTIKDRDLILSYRRG
ncbi:MAG TPA: lipocalin family protein [Parapedobacter sp.]|nr:lipocalin family protein [Parapedobacter sp.]